MGRTAGQGRLVSGTTHRHAHSVPEWNVRYPVNKPNIHLVACNSCKAKKCVTELA